MAIYFWLKIPFLRICRIYFLFWFTIFLKNRGSSSSVSWLSSISMDSNIMSSPLSISIWPSDCFCFFAQWTFQYTDVYVVCMIGVERGNCNCKTAGSSLLTDIFWYFFLIRVITKLPNSEQSYKGKVKTHNYINRQNQSTTGKLWKP